MCWGDNTTLAHVLLSVLSTDTLLLIRYIDDVLSLNNSRFGDFLHLIYPSQREIKDTTDSLLLILTFISKLTQEED